MGKIPDEPRDIFESLVQDCLGQYGENLLSLIVYGSAADGSYVKGTSDINILMVLTPQGITDLDACLPLVKKWRRYNVAVPLLLTKEFINSSVDTYPIEFLNMKNNYEHIYGEDVLDPLVINSADLRLQIERELKGKILWLREGFLESGGSARRVGKLIAGSVKSFVPIFNALLYLKTGEKPEGKYDTINRMGAVFGLNEAVFEFCFSMGNGAGRMKTEEVHSLFNRYLEETRTIAETVDLL